MRYQERIYIQNDNRAVRNKDILNVNMSSDICIFKSPSFGLSGATKLQCGPITCELSGFSSQNILTAATYDCFTSKGMADDCFSSLTWTTKIYEDNNLSYSASYYTTSNLTGDTPPDIAFFNNLINGLTYLNYSYTLEDTTLIVNKKYGGAKDLEYDLCLTWGIRQTGYTCPSGFSLTPSKDGCQKIITSAATNNGTSAPIAAGNTGTSYVNTGTYFYPTVQNNQALPVYYDSLGTLFDQTGGTITATNIVSSLNTFWANNPATGSNGRLNNIGISASTTEWLGFSKCINISTPGTYYIGIGADNDARFRVDGVTYVNLTGSSVYNFTIWSVFPFYFTSGSHIIEMEGLNTGSITSFGAEIYYPTGATSFATLTAATSTAATQANSIFSTANFVGGYWQLGTTVGYSCSSGYSLNFCTETPSCTRIENASATAMTCTSCTENCNTICNDTFPYIDNNSQGVYLLDSDITNITIPFVFNFTANTSVFTANNATFKYKIYRYVPESGVFRLPPVYESRNILYSEISGITANTLTQSIPVSGLSVDGDYIIKGFFEADACTDFLKRLGKKIDTTINNQGSVSQIYQPELDYYFTALRKADTPYFTFSQINEDLIPTGGVDLYQQTIIVQTYEPPPYQSNPNTTPIIPYFRTGSTFAFASDYAGDVVVTLNGLTLSKDIDYTLSGQVLTMLGYVTNNDIITIIYTRITNRPIVSEPIYIDKTIISGTTNNQGSEKYYYNTTKNKYEIFVDNVPLAGSNIIVILNGITLTNNIDFYQSTSDSRRIILNGTIMLNDIINVIYYPSATVINGITATNNYISWYINNPPQAINGRFYLEYASTPIFSTYKTSDIVPYIVNLTNYSGILTLTGSVGTNYYYRVKNIKDYVSVCGDNISSTAYSETVKVKIQSNGINSY